MNKKIVISIAGVFLLIILVAVAFVYRDMFLSAPQEGETQLPDLSSPPQTRAPAPTNLTIPDEKAVDVPEDVAVPTLVAPTLGRDDTRYRVFNISVVGGRFTPNTINVNPGDILRLRFTAVDADYAFTQPDYGVDVPLPKGVTKTIELGQAESGSFLFYCEVCGGPEKGPTGKLNVAATSQGL